LFQVLILREPIRNFYEIYRTHVSLLFHKQISFDVISANISTEPRHRHFQTHRKLSGRFPTDITIVQQNCALEHTLILSVFVVGLLILHLTYLIWN